MEYTVRRVFSEKTFFNHFFNETKQGVFNSNFHPELCVILLQITIESCYLSQLFKCVVCLQNT